MRFVYPRDFAGQFMLGESVPELPGAVSHRLPTLQAAIAAPLPLIPVRDGAGGEIGALLGWPVRPGRGVVTGGLDLAARPGGDPEDFVEREIYPLGGSFIFILDMPGARRVYLDACGSLSAVYDPGTRLVAATALPLMTPEESEARFDAELHEALNILLDGWFPAGLSAHRGIFRLMPNHYLDLDSFQTRRHWPRAALPVTADPRAACATILASSRAIMRGLLNTGPVAQALTAGNETRMLLAAVRDFHAELQFVTVKAVGAELDLTRSRELARRFGLDHRVIGVVEGSREDGEDWYARTGYCFGGPHIRTHPTVRALADRPFFIGGLGGEIGRGFFWRESDDDETEITAEGIWARMGMPRHPRGIEAVEGWLPSVAGLPGLLQLDLAYLELRMGCWGFAPSYTKTAPLDFHPLISRESFASMLSLPPDWRRMQGMSNRMIGGVIDQGWPELMEFPISRYGDYRDRVHFLRRLARNPHFVMKKLRKKFG